MVGNGVFNISSLDNSTYYFFDDHEFFSPALSAIWENQCQTDPAGAKCLYFKTQADDIMYLVDPYSVYGECWGGFDLIKGFHPVYQRLFNKRSEDVLRRKLGSSRRFGNSVGDSGAPCADFGTYQTYFNTLSVKQAIHVNTTVEWNACADIDYHISPAGSFPCYIDTLFEQVAKGFKILIYSGDVDGVVPTVDTLYNIEVLNNRTSGKINKDWHQWKTPSLQVGGQAVSYT